VSPAATASRSVRSNRVVSVGDFIMVMSLKRTAGRDPAAKLRGTSGGREKDGRG
jgi:hypothetical protein